MCVTVARKIKVVAGAFILLFFFENRGIPENFWEFPNISGNSRGKNKKKNVVAPRSGKKVVAAQR